MFKKHSLYQRILLPVTVIMLLQAMLISLVLFANGTVRSLQNNAVEDMDRNVVNRGLTLENTMVHNWSNLDKLENEVIATINTYVSQYKLPLDEVIGSDIHEGAMLSAMSRTLLDALRTSFSTGVYLYFVRDGDLDANGEIDRNGLYYRDLDPVSTPADYSDILYLRGVVSIARKDKIQLDSLWSESFVFSPAYTDIWRGFSKPLKAALDYPRLSSADLSYWNTPHFTNPNESLDANECISYTRPIIIDGRPVAMIGTEVQTEQLLRYFPSNDFGNSGQGGYVLLTYQKDDEFADSLPGRIYSVNGSYLKRMLNGKDLITLDTDKKLNARAFTGEAEDAKAVLRPLRLYNNHTPFSAEQWALAAFGTDQMLFGAARSVTNGVIVSTLIAFLAGVFLLGVIIRVTTRPLIRLANQIEKSNPSEPIPATDTGIYELELLYTTINEMRTKRRAIEMELREERERYLVALESAADTFVEYDVGRDVFMLYRFTEKNQTSALDTQVIRSFAVKLHGGEICPSEDIPLLAAFLSGRSSVETRIRASYFPHITGIEADGDYHWFLLKASHIYDDAGNLRKAIGVARLITGEKRNELAAFEAERRDPTTGFYNPEYGTRLIEKRILASLADNAPFSLCVLRLDGFESLEAHYGRVFSAAVLMELSARKPRWKNPEDIVVRLNNDECMLFLAGAGKEESEARFRRICDGLPDVYVGENPDLRLSISTGAAVSDGISDYNILYVRARQALHGAVESGGGCFVSYDSLPPLAQSKPAPNRARPISVSLNISKEGAVAFVFDMFERTTDTQSSINLLLGILGKLFSLNRVLVCSYDADFGSHMVTNQWNAPPLPKRQQNVEIISRSDFGLFEQMLDTNGAFMYSSKQARTFNPALRRLLCVQAGEPCAALGCVMYENSICTGSMLFQSADVDKTWGDEELYNLHEIAKIVSAHISIERSNTASRAKSEFLSRVSHEIRTPMNAIIGMTNIARECISLPERLEDCLEKIDFSAKHLLTLINDVLEMSRIESGRLDIKYEPFSLPVLMDTLETLMRLQMESKHICFIVERRTAKDIVIGDEYRLRQVLVNLLSNAAKFTDAGGTVMLEVEELREPDKNGSGHGLFRFSVKDTGIGISKEDQLVVFKAFEQARSPAATRIRHEGTGLGLSISSSIISAMGGRIELQSEVGVGSEFYFTLDMELGGSLRDNGAADEVTDYRTCFEGKNALLVEDNEINIEIAEYAMDSVGFSVTKAQNGKEGVERFFASPNGFFDVIIMDIQMPVMDGLEATREIRKNTSRPDARTVPIIAMTANAFDEDMKKSIESGMNGHVAKPVEREALYRLLKQTLGPSNSTPKATTWEE